ncbi:adenylate kinase family protein [Mycoplasma buteonis]|uniref:adenylate kinase family protein n=1 Tax=Mycoplasma buteonis TaxID=171280 RepID=UPI00055EDABE|nr:nucleoside monophosphate kinase [Mycoplasma buteonis]
MINKNIIFMGMPGAGKGTVASLIKEKTNLFHLSTGEVFRNEIKNKTDLGLKVQEYVTSGGYVPDEITNKIVAKAIDSLIENKQRFILDGYPRTLAQVEFLQAQYGDQFAVIELKVSVDEVLRRLGGRRVCPLCQTAYHVEFKKPKNEGHCDLDNQELLIRADDYADKIVNRLDIYNQQTKPLLNYYQNSNNLYTVDASATPDEVAKKVLEIINNI